MLERSLADSLDEYLDKNWDAMLADMERLVCIESVQDLQHATKEMPYGPGPARALEEALDLWSSYGFAAHNCEGRIGYADWPGASEKQIGIIGHVDVVPLGEGWHFDPLRVTRKDGYLLGRGVSDDKGPLIMALHAAQYWKQQGARFPYTLRFIIGNNEETGMRDVEYYQEHFEDPELLFSPDDEFPVCYGEKGVLHGMIYSAEINDGLIEEWSGGLAVNAVPGSMSAVLKCDAKDLPHAKDIEIDDLGSGRTRLIAHGVQAHASTPEEGRSALKTMVEYLLDLGIFQSEELDWVELVHDIVRAYDGSGLGLESCCPYFHELTLVGGLAGKEDKVFSQSVDIRFGSLHTLEQLESVLQKRAARCAANFKLDSGTPPFMMDKDGILVQTLLGSYRDVTGDMQDAFTIGGATYSRHFKAGVGFGVDVHGQERPAWVGGMHAVDEGVSEAWLKDAFKVYAVAIKRLMALEL